MSVYGLLQQHWAGDRTADRLLDALRELAARVESVGQDAPHWTTRPSHPSQLPLPDPAQNSGELPLMPGACEHAALQAAADASSMQLRSTAARQAWRSWLLAPRQCERVLDAAWQLVLLLYRRQGEAAAAALQEHIFARLQQEYVSRVLCSDEPLQDTGPLWCEALADAGCRLLRAAFPAAPELHAPQVQQLLQQQLRLFTTGLLPGDDLAAPRADTAGADADADAATDATRDSKTHSCSHRQPAFVSVKPSPCVAAYLARQGLRPAPQVLQPCTHTPGIGSRPPKQGQRLKQQQTQTQQMQTQQMQTQYCTATAQPAAPAATHTARGRACVAAASAAAEAYCARKAAAVAAVRAGTRGLRRAGQQLQQQRTQAIAAGASRAKPLSNALSGERLVGMHAATSVSERAASTAVARLPLPAGWLSAAGAASVAVAPAASCKQSGVAASSGHRGRQQRAAAVVQSTPSLLSATDVACKAHRQQLDAQLRATEWRVAHGHNHTVHDRCANLAAAAAVLPPAAVTPLPASAAAAASGQDWGALISSSVVRSRVSCAAGAADEPGTERGAHTQHTRSSFKTAKAARAIVEDVQRALAASAGPR